MIEPKGKRSSPFFIWKFPFNLINKLAYKLRPPQGEIAQTKIKNGDILPLSKAIDELILNEKERMILGKNALFVRESHRQSVVINEIKILYY